MNLLHGKEGTNRWFDKHMIIVSASGTLGMNFDHACNDGLNWNRMLTETWHDMIGKDSGFSPLPQQTAASTIGPVQPLSWNVSDSVKSSLALASTEAAILVNDTDTHVLEFEDFGRNEIKNWKMSPDGFNFST